MSYAIKKIVALGISSLVLTSSHVWAENFSNPNDIRVSLQQAHKICTLDFDHDGDLDIVFYHGVAMTLQENIGVIDCATFFAQESNCR